jgi:hypothetical protein
MKLSAIVCLSLLVSIAWGQQPKYSSTAHHPALIPMPQQVTWNAGSAFVLASCKNICYSDTTLQAQAAALQEFVRSKGGRPGIQLTKPKYPAATIALQLMQPSGTTTHPEAYQLMVNNRQITLSAWSLHGIHNGLQTLYQLAAADNKLPACTINDWPAFSWRGYMIDVGRNYVSLPLLQQQIDVMARYKFNVFHFHATEDIAWRIESKQYPQLTDAATMTRNKGSYYSQQDIKALIAYCKERFITFVPEIDMPGHSAAFTRAMNTNMQTDSGLAIVKNILREFCTTYNLPYIHIGADEVKISNPGFIPAVTNLLESYGKQVIGWQPGGNFNQQTIRQLWMDDATYINAPAGTRFIDSRHLYLNHMDPLEAVVTLFNRQIGNKVRGDSSMLGATLCLWHDRKVANEADLLRMNPVYPGMLAFAERAWRGGGTAGWIANINEGDRPAFMAFEDRLLRHKTWYFQDKPFPYTRQSGIQWKLYGPYNNEGNLTRSFNPENPGWSTQKRFPATTATGGTIVLRHWWAPLIKGAIDSPRANTTWYATTRIWSKRDTIATYWIGFNNLSRSPATDSPPTGAWDTKASAVWVNGALIAPPTWQRAGQPGNAEIPLIDEGYEYRLPTMIHLQKGWNHILIKAPVGPFQGKNWQNPVKWLFTFCAAPTP